MGGVHDEDDLRARIIEFLGASTRNGLYRTNGLVKVVDLGNGRRLDSKGVEDAINARSQKDISPYVLTLCNGRAATLALGSSDLLKLRATLLLGLGEARFLTSDERRMAFARTYRVYIPAGRKALEGIDQFRDRYQDVRRVEREEVIATVADIILEWLKIQQPSVDIVGSKAPWTYEIVDAQDDYLYPASVEGQVRTVIRRRTIRSIAPAITEFRQTYSDRVPGGSMPEARNVGQGQLTIQNLRPYEENGAPGYRYDIVISFPPLQRGKTLEIGWLLTHQLTKRDQWGPGIIHRVQLTPAVPIGKLSISVRFSPPLVPSNIWRVDNVAPQNIIQVEARGEALTPTQDRVQAVWEGVTLGRACGIVWNWPENLH